MGRIDHALISRLAYSHILSPDRQRICGRSRTGSARNLPPCRIPRRITPWCLHAVIPRRNVSLLVKQILDLQQNEARQTLEYIGERYPIVVTRNLQAAKDWVRSQARGTERYGIVVSSEAQRLKPYAIDVRTPMDPIHWFLDGKND